MAVHSNFGSFANKMSSKTRRIQIAIRQASDQAEKEILQSAHIAMSGDISQRELNRRGNPFGRKRGRVTKRFQLSPKHRRAYRVSNRRTSVTPTPLMPINDQTGNLKRATRWRGSIKGTRELVASKHYAEFILGEGGTKQMIDRGFAKYMQKVGKYAIARAKPIVIKAIHS